MSFKTLSEGAQGETVKQLQSYLDDVGHYDGMIDGDYGPMTKEAVLSYQKAQDLIVDGVAGPQVWQTLESGIRDQKLLSEADIGRAAKRLKLPKAVIKAFADVESGPYGGFFDNGHATILFERHIMNRRCKEYGLELLAQIARKERPDLVLGKPGGYRGGKNEIPRLTKAAELNPICARESCSWGAYQIMGYHWQRLGYQSVEDFVSAMQTSEGKQLDALVAFIKADPDLHEALKERDWARVAEIYNGPAYEKNEYDLKLEEAFHRFSSKK